MTRAPGTASPSPVGITSCNAGPVCASRGRHPQAAPRNLAPLLIDEWSVEQPQGELHAQQTVWGLLEPGRTTRDRAARGGLQEIPAFLPPNWSMPASCSISMRCSRKMTFLPPLGRYSDGTRRVLVTGGILHHVSLPPVVSARDLRVSFGSRHALDGLSLEVAAGSVTSLLGPNGAGKTTFIRCCTGLVQPDAGTLELFGHAPGSPEVLPRVGLMPQQTGAWSQIAPRQLLGYLSKLYKHPHPADALMTTLGIHSFATTPYRRLSGGQQQLVNLAGALIGRPDAVFLDEPTAGLDVRAKRSVWELVRKVRDAGVAVLLTTHDMFEAANLADDVHIIDRGRITVQGTVDELTRDQDLEEVFLAHTSPAEDT